MYTKLRNLTSLWKCWYVILCVCMYTMLLYHTVRDYRTYKTRAYNPRFGNQWSEAPLNICVGILVIVCALIPVHIYANLMRVGNMVNDGDSLMHNAGVVLKTHLDQMYEFSSTKLIRLRMWRHLRPCAYLIHIITAMVLLLPMPLLQAEQIKNEALSKDHLWTSEMMSLLTGVLAPMDGMNFYNLEGLSHNYIHQSSLSLFSVNFLFGALLVANNYPAVYWSSNHSFSNLYSLFIMLSLLQTFLEFHTFSLFHKLSVNGILTDPGIFLSSWNCLLLLLLGFFVLLLMLLAMFEYGYLHALLSLSRHRQYFLSDKSSKVFVEETIVKTSNQCMSKHWPSVLGLGCLLFWLAVKIPTMGQYVLCYRSTQHCLFLLNVLFTAGTLTLALLLWFTLCVKREWNFNLKFALLQSPTARGSDVTGPVGVGQSANRQLMTSPSVDTSVYNYYADQGGIHSGPESGQLPLLMSQSGNLSDIMTGRPNTVGHSAASTIDRYMNVNNAYPLSLLPSTIDEHILDNGVPEDSPSVSSSRPRELNSNQSSSSHAETSLIGGINPGKHAYHPPARMGVIGAEMEPNYATISSLLGGQPTQNNNAFPSFNGSQLGSNKFRRTTSNRMAAGFKSPISNHDMMMPPFHNSPNLSLQTSNSGRYDDYQMVSDFMDPASLANYMPHRTLNTNSGANVTVPDILQGNDLMLASSGTGDAMMMAWQGARAAGFPPQQHLKGLEPSQAYGGSQDLTVDITDNDLLDNARSMDNCHLDENGDSKLCSEV